MAGDPKSSPTRHKALEINLDPKIYGSFAEIGAGQEVARHFFKAGGAAGTVAKTMSAYDMQFSDALYGQDASGRYVTRTRLISMLEREFAEVTERVASTRPEGSRFFAFADTVAAKSYLGDADCHGWMGLCFQHEPCAPPSQIVLHVRMFDNSAAGQQDSLGILGVNLIHATSNQLGDGERLVEALRDNLVWGRIEIDYIHLSGPAFARVDNVALNLHLVTASLGPVATFSPDGQAALPADLIHGKDVLILRGSFRPFTAVNEDMIECGQGRFAETVGVGADRIAFFCEMNIARYLSEGLDELSDLKERVESITSQGHHVMVTSHYRFFRLGEYFSKHAKRRIGFILSVDNILSIFDDKYYEGMEGGILDALARLFSSDSKLLVYPNLTTEGEVLTVGNLKVPDHLKYLYRHLVHNNRILSLTPRRDTLVPFGP